MITRINWKDNRGNNRQDVVLSSFYYEEHNYAVVAFNDFTIIKYDNTGTKFSTVDNQSYKDLYT